MLCLIHRPRKSDWKRAALPCPHVPPGAFAEPADATRDPLKDPAKTGPPLLRQELWIRSRVLLLENKDGSASEKTFKEKAKTIALRNHLCAVPHELGDASWEVTSSRRRHHCP